MENSDCNSSSVSNDTVMQISPGGTKYYVPQCDPSMKPYEGQTFDELDDAFAFYKSYASVCGFDIRLGSESTVGDRITWKYVFCNREGKKNKSSVVCETAPKRRRTVSNRVCCMARVVFKFGGCDGYITTKFIERHTHALVPKAYKHLMKMNRHLDYGQQILALNCAKANIGPMASYKLLKEVFGGFGNIGATRVDVKNFSRDMKAYVIGRDDQMLVDNLLRRREMCPAFVFDYEVDSENRLKRLFWADPTSRRNFHAFGDVISFDATYETNGYKMIFAPFTGKDNHGRCVTFGASLMTSEDKEAYAWVFERFKECMGVGPKIIMTDQDPAIKVAVARALPGTKHRLCMWHIMRKVSEKVPPALKKDVSFTKKFCSIVWSVLDEPIAFEAKWEQTIMEFGLSDNKWLQSIYDIRDTWIPAYFREFPMGGLFRTTSMSESENSFFGRFMNEGANLLEFLMFFDSAIDSQRHSNAQLNNEALSCYPDCRTPFLFEKHASNIYTRHIFSEVQNDIYSACYECRLKRIIEDDSTCYYDVDDCTNGVFNVVYNKAENSIVCSCKKFVGVGLLCCHIFFVFKDRKFEEIPEKYVVSRWTKFPVLNSTHMTGARVDSSTIDVEENKIAQNEVVSEFFSCMELIEADPDQTRSLLHVMKEFKENLQSSKEQPSRNSVKRKLFARFYGSSVPEEVRVKPPAIVKTKGSGSDLKSRKDKAIEQSKKPIRKCSNCQQMCHHDARNCPN